MSRSVLIAAMSDLHIEFQRPKGQKSHEVACASGNHPRNGPNLDRCRECAPDLMILAGDIDNGKHAVAYAGEVARFLKCPTILVPGNHEYYGGKIPNTLLEMRAMASELPDVYVLDCDRVDFAIRGRIVRVLGCTLWTDYKLSGSPALSGAIATLQLRDHRQIKRAEGRPFRPVDALALHRKALAWLDEQMQQPFEGTTVVVSHHGVSPSNVPPEYLGHALTAAYVSDLEARIQTWKPQLWITGHTHHSHEDQVGETRLVSRQAGYPDDTAADFSPWLGEI